MIVYQFATYVLLLSYNPCDIFTYYNVSEMHGLNAIDCQAHANTKDSAYIAGWTNYVPKASGKYKSKDNVFVFINLSRCNDDIHTTALVMHEMMHLSGHMYDGCWDSHEEEMISFAEKETYKVVELIKKVKNEKSL